MDKLLELLGKAAKEREERIDRLFEILRDLPGASEHVSDLRKAVAAEIRASQLLRNLGFGLLLLCVVLGVLGGGWAWLQKQRQRQALVYLESENLPVSFYNARNGDLLVRFSPRDTTLQSPVPEVVRELTRSSGGFGRHPGLGASRELPVDFGREYEDGLRFVVHPNDEATILGQVTIQTTNGRLETQEDAIVPGDPPRQFQDLPQFALEIRDFDSIRREWTIGFCERESCESGAYVVRKSPGGQRQEHFFVSGPDWTAVYLVSIGLGEQGEGGQVWTVNARATRFGWTSVQ